MHPLLSTSPLGDSCLLQSPSWIPVPQSFVPSFHSLLREHTIPTTHTPLGFPVSALPFHLFQGSEMNSVSLPPRQRLWVSAGGGGGIGQTGQPSASPLPLVLFSIPATLPLPMPGTDKVQLEAGTSCDCAHSPIPTQTLPDSCTPRSPPWNPCPALAWVASRWGERVELLLPWQPSTPP